METLSIIITRNYTILSDFDAEDAPAPLLYTEEAHSSHFIRSLPPDVVQALQQSPIAMENHGKGTVACFCLRISYRGWLLESPVVHLMSVHMRVHILVVCCPSALGAGVFYGRLAVLLPVRCTHAFGLAAASSAPVRLTLLLGVLQVGRQHRTHTILSLWSHPSRMAVLL